MRTIQREIVSALIFSKDAKLLMGKKDPKAGGVYADSWHIPGGGIGENESQIQALTREIQEEVGIDISKAQFELVSDDGRGSAEKTLKDSGETVLVEMQFNVYKVTLLEDSDAVRVVLTDDLAEYKWFDATQLKKVKLTPPSIALFKKLNLL